MGRYVTIRAVAKGVSGGVTRRLREKNLNVEFFVDVAPLSSWLYKEIMFSVNKKALRSARKHTWVPCRENLLVNHLQRNSWSMVNTEIQGKTDQEFLVNRGPLMAPFWIYFGAMLGVMLELF